MAKVGLMAFATALLLTGSGYAADKIAFKCTGTLRDATGKSESIAETTLVIDRDAGLVSGKFGRTSIASEGPKPGYRFELGIINENTEGFLNRQTATLWGGQVRWFHNITRENGKIIRTVEWWDLSCISPNPDFPVVYGRVTVTTTDLGVGALLVPIPRVEAPDPFTPSIGGVRVDGDFWAPGEFEGLLKGPR